MEDKTQRATTGEVQRRRAAEVVALGLYGLGSGCKDLGREGKKF